MLLALVSSTVTRRTYPTTTRAGLSVNACAVGTVVIIGVAVPLGAGPAECTGTTRSKTSHGLSVNSRSSGEQKEYKAREGSRQDNSEFSTRYLH